MANRYGTEGNDIIDGTFVADIIGAYGGNDVLRGFAGDDLIFAGADDDWMDGGSSGITVRSLVGRSWQASRTFGGAPTRFSTRSSSGVGWGTRAEAGPIRERQVEQRPRPPQSEACGMPAARLASSTDIPGVATMRRPPG